MSNRYKVQYIGMNRRYIAKYGRIHPNDIIEMDEDDYRHYITLKNLFIPLAKPTIEDMIEDELLIDDMQVRINAKTKLVKRKRRNE